jgi:hypothetical protein
VDFNFSMFILLLPSFGIDLFRDTFQLGDKSRVTHCNFLQRRVGLLRQRLADALKGRAFTSQLLLFSRSPRPIISSFSSLPATLCHEHCRLHSHIASTALHCNAACAAMAAHHLVRCQLCRVPEQLSRSFCAAASSHLSSPGKIL